MEKPEDVQVTFLAQNFDFWACRSHSVVKRDASGKKGKLLCCKCIFDRIKLIWPRSSLKTTKMSKNAFFAKSSRSQWVNTIISSND